MNTLTISNASSVAGDVEPGFSPLHAATAQHDHDAKNQNPACHPASVSNLFGLTANAVVPAIPRNAARLPTVRQFHSYRRLMPGAEDSAAT